MYLAFTLLHHPLPNGVLRQQTEIVDLTRTLGAQFLLSPKYRHHANGMIRMIRIIKEKEQPPDIKIQSQSYFLTQFVLERESEMV
jgi:hypothetical protein